MSKFTCKPTSIAAGSLAVTMLLALSACSNMSTRDQNTAMGAGIGAVGGAVLTGGSSVGTLGGAAIGGMIGHQVSK
jgi:osmotically inducible lipoprotein OsmB